LLAVPRAACSAEAHSLAAARLAKASQRVLEPVLGARLELPQPELAPESELQVRAQALPLPLPLPVLARPACPKCGAPRARPSPRAMPYPKVASRSVCDSRDASKNAV